MNSIAQSTRHEDPELRFAFGRNWRSSLATLDDHRIDGARRRLCESLGRDNLHSIRALDIGSGSGLSSLVMHQLGAAYGFESQRQTLTRGLGGNEFVFKQAATSHAK